jgi:hypothetical protein
MTSLSSRTRLEAPHPADFDDDFVAFEAAAAEHQPSLKPFPVKTPLLPVKKALLPELTLLPPVDTVPTPTAPEPTPVSAPAPAADAPLAGRREAPTKSVKFS